MKYALSLFLILISCSFFLFENPACATDLKRSLKQYKGVRVSNQAMHRLADYNSLIDYYTQFTFFRKNHKVSPDFIRALIIAESNVKAKAVSSKGARGLGQIMYTTGQEAAKEISKLGYSFRYINPQKLVHLQEEDLFDPAMNILLTCYLISKYNYKFKGKLELVLSAWNAGENHGELRRGRPVPYRETLNLIGKINGYYIDLLERKKRINIRTRQ
jgi:soluble lytic murein transglycosylase-like protein